MMIDVGVEGSERRPVFESAMRTTKTSSSMSKPLIGTVPPSRVLICERIVSSPQFASSGSVEAWTSMTSRSRGASTRVGSSDSTSSAAKVPSHVTRS